MVQMAILGIVVGVESEKNGTVRWLSFLRKPGRGALFMYLEGSFLPMRYFFQSRCGFQFLLYALLTSDNNFFVSSPPVSPVVLGGRAYLACGCCSWW